MIHRYGSTGLTKEPSQEDERAVFMPAPSLPLSFLFVPSQVITINCAMRAALRSVYREASTNPSSAFRPSFLEAIACHIFTVLFLTARIKVHFTTQPFQCPSLPPPKGGRKRVIGL